MLHLLLEYGVQPASSAEGLLQRLTSTVDMAAVELLQRFGFDIEDCTLSDGRTMLHLLVPSRFLTNRAVSLPPQSSSASVTAGGFNVALPAFPYGTPALFGKYSATAPSFGFGAAFSQQATATSNFSFGHIQNTLGAHPSTPDGLDLFETNVKDWQDQAAPLMQLLLTKDGTVMKRDNSNQTQMDICAPEYTQFMSARTNVTLTGHTGASGRHEQGPARCVICLDRQPTVASYHVAIFVSVSSALAT